jgi:hypothetical protein
MITGRPLARYQLDTSEPEELEEPARYAERLERRRAWMRALEEHPSLALLLDNPMMASMVFESYLPRAKRRDAPPRGHEPDTSSGSGDAAPEEERQ